MLEFNRQNQLIPAHGSNRTNHLLNYLGKSLLQSSVSTITIDADVVDNATQGIIKNITTVFVSQTADVFLNLNNTTPWVGIAPEAIPATTVPFFIHTPYQLVSLLNTTEKQYQHYGPKHLLYVATIVVLYAMVFLTLIGIQIRRRLVTLKRGPNDEHYSLLTDKKEQLHQDKLKRQRLNVMRLNGVKDAYELDLMPVHDV